MTGVQSNYERLLRGVATAAAALGLTMDGSLVPVVVLKRPASRENLDDLEGFQVYPGTGNPARERLFGDTWWVWYIVGVQLMAPGNMDLQGHLGDYLTWQEALGHRLSDPTAILGCVESVQVVDQTPVDQGAVADLYDFGLLSFTFKTAEDHGS